MELKLSFEKNKNKTNKQTKQILKAKGQTTFISATLVWSYLYPLLTSEDFSTPFSDPHLTPYLNPGFFA